MVNGPLISDTPLVTRSDALSMVNALAHWTLLTRTLPTERTTPLPDPLVMTASSVGPGETPPLQLRASPHELPSPAPTQ